MPFFAAQITFKSIRTDNLHTLLVRLLFLARLVDKYVVVLVSGIVAAEASFPSSEKQPGSPKSGGGGGGGYLESKQKLGF